MPSRCLVFQNQGFWFPFLVFIASNSSSTNFRKTRAAELYGVVKRLWEGNASKWVVKRARQELWLPRNGATCLKCWDGDRVHNAVHPSRTACAKDIKLICDVSYVIAACWDFGRNLFGIESTAWSAWWRNKSTGMWRLSVVYYKFCSKEIWSETDGSFDISHRRFNE